MAGLGGAVVGAGGALLGGWLQHRQQARTANQERREQRGISVGDAALGELLSLRRHLDSVIMVASAQLPENWRGPVWQHLREAELAVLLIPNSGPLRARMDVIFKVLRNFDMGGNTVTRKSAGALVVCQEAILVLSAFLRGDEVLPAPRPIFLSFAEALELREERARLLAATEGMVGEDD